MLHTLLAISEFATKLVAGLSGVVFGIIILIAAIRAKNRVKPEDSPAELKRRAKAQNEQVEQDALKKKNKRHKAAQQYVEDDEQDESDESEDEDEEYDEDEENE